MPQTPSALLLISTSCPHCPSVLQSLCELIKEGKIANLEVVNIEQNSARAQALNVRSVPWLKLGEYELVGLKSKTEILQWIERSTQSGDMSAYFEELMTTGEISKVQQLVEEQPENMQTLLNIMADENASLSARVGVGAIIEQLAGSEILINAIDALGEHCKNPRARVRNDACYYLGLSHHPNAKKYIQPLLKDADDEVREVAQEALDEINLDEIKYES